VSPADTLGVILAGGRARRMGCIDKTRIPIDGATIFDRVVARLRRQCVHLVVNANTDAARFADTGLPVVADSIANFPGPLAGILAGLDFAATQIPEIGWILSAPADCPFLPGDLVLRLHQARLTAGATLACAESGERRHPVIGLWPVSLREALRRALIHEDAHKVGEWSAYYPLAVAEWPTEPVDPFFNVNTPEDAAEAERLARRFPEI
jgi:molybdenum cofactor guanylyltransferase